MNTDYGFSNNLLSKYDFGGYSTGQFNYSSGSYAKKENADITIITDDGDRVTISSATSMESSYTSYSGLVRSGDSSVKAEGYEYQSQLQSNFSMSVVGDLDSEEYDDIISALKTIDSFMKNASSGNMEDLQAVAEQFGMLDSLSGLNATIQVQESMSLEQAQSVISESGETEGKGHKDHNRADKLDHALDKIMDSGKKHGKANGHVKQLMNDYLTGLLDSFSKKTEKNDHGQGTGELLKNMILDRLEEKVKDEESIVDKT